MSARREAVCRAAALIDDPNTLCALLGVTPRELRAWVEGSESPPVAVFLKAVDIIDAHASAELLGHAIPPKPGPYVITPPRGARLPLVCVSGPRRAPVSGTLAV